MYSSIYAESKEMYNELVEWRRELHKIPELGLELPKTVSFVKKKMMEWDIPVSYTHLFPLCMIQHLINALI